MKGARRALARLIFELVCILGVMAWGVGVAHRLGELERRAALVPLTFPPARHFVAPTRADTLTAELVKLDGRTVYLYTAFDTLLHEASCWAPERMKLPDPSPWGWKPLKVQREPRSWRALTDGSEP